MSGKPSLKMNREKELRKKDSEFQKLKAWLQILTCNISAQLKCFHPWS